MMLTVHSARDAQLSASKHAGLTSRLACSRQAASLQQCWQLSGKLPVSATDVTLID
jgi:hypothetical protein